MLTRETTITLGISERQLYRLVNKGKLTPVKVGRDLHYDAAQVAQLQSERQAAKVRKN